MADYNTKPQSRSEEILRALIDGDQYNKKAQSRIEYLLKQLITVLDGKADLDEDGLIPVSELPPVVFEHMMEVVDDTARFALTTDDVQNGDYVYVDSSNIMYFVIDDTKLDMEAGYKPVAAGIAAKAVGDKNGNDITTTYQTKIDSQHKLDADSVDDTNATNKFVTATDKTTWNGKQDALTFDSAPTASSNNPVTSGGIYTALADKQATIDSSHKLSSDLIDDTNHTNKFATAAQLSQIATNTSDISNIQQTIGNINTVLEEVL